MQMQNCSVGFSLRVFIRIVYKDVAYVLAFVGIDRRLKPTLQLFISSVCAG
jgi:hypothetical protein